MIKFMLQLTEKGPPMAHHFKVESRPHLNKDGSPSKTRREYRVIDRPRKNRRLIGEVSSQKDAQVLLQSAREAVIRLHADQHPNDRAFLRKHKLMGDA